MGGVLGNRADGTHLASVEAGIELGGIWKHAKAMIVLEAAVLS